MKKIKVKHYSVKKYCIIYNVENTMRAAVLFVAATNCFLDIKIRVSTAYTNAFTKS